MRFAITVLTIFMFIGGFKSEARAGDGLVALTIGDKILYVEVAATPKKRQKGLMFREKLEKDHGMLFVFRKSQRLHFWMKNTKIPLSVAYIKSDGWIAQIEHLEPLDLKPRGSETRVKFALEMNAGWFKKNSIKVGDKIDIPPAIAILKR